MLPVLDTLFNTIKSNPLIVGGGVAVIASSWQRVKEIAGYLSGFVFIHTTIDPQFVPALRQYLYDEWWLVPAGKTEYRTIYKTFKGESIQKLVPYSVLPRRSVHLRWGGLLPEILIVNAENADISLTSIRGLVSFHKLVGNALEAWEALRNGDQEDQPSRFIVRIKTGSFGGHVNAYQGGNSVHANKSLAPDSSEMAQSRSDWFIPALDDSFMYDPDDFTVVREDDPFKSLYFSPEVTKYIKQATDWYKLKDWYADHDIPWRRGWLLYGPGGTGKSAMAKAVAQQLGFPIYQYYLSTYSDREFIQDWSEMTLPAVVLFEDFDNVFDKRTPVNEDCPLSFDCVLNQISGVNTTNGVFLIITTNNIEKIDPALGIPKEGKEGLSSRPGRIDNVIYVGEMDEASRFRMAERILDEWPELIPDIVVKGEGMTPAQFQELCRETAYSRIDLDEL